MSLRMGNFERKKLVDPLVRKTEELRGVTCAHLPASAT